MKKRKIIEQVKKEVAKSNLEYYRKQRGLSQEELAVLAGLHKNTIYKIENGFNPSFTTLQQLCKVLNITIDELIGNGLS